MAARRRLGALLLCVALGILGIECTKGKEGDACAADGECDLGFFCRSSTKVCTYECRRNADCLSNICDINGRCYVADGGASDAGAQDGGAADAGPDASSDAGGTGGDAGADGG
ncbi:MAG: hypothetical protein HYY84_18500 [Deltaproteobacteria bacterium]|nr:hypothetical protein [Deltaproteobacteria bacterium]